MIDGIVIDFPAIVKAHAANDGRRMVEVEASVEKVDSEGDLILQQALLDAAPDFIRTGHLDIDHISELGTRLGIADPTSYIVGRPREVKDIGDKRTSVVGEIMRSPNGQHDPTRNKYDAFWESLHANPPVLWRASIYGFPKDGEIVDCSTETCDSGISRYLIKGIEWRSLAFTRNPVNDSIVGAARIITAKAFVIAKGGVPFVPTNDAPGFPGMEMKANGLAPRSLTDAVGQYHRHMRNSCEYTQGINTVIGFKSHFEKCCGMAEEEADLYAHALMYHVLRESRRA